MARIVGIGKQDFETIITGNYFYVDKTYFIKEWWNNGDDVTLFTRPRRFGKTLTISMVEKFFSTKYADRGDLFEGLSIWEDEEYRKLQGTYPVISLSFANVKDKNYETTRRKICQLLVNLYVQNSFLLESDVLTEKDRAFFQSMSVDMGDVEASMAIYQLSDYLTRYYGKKVIILLDEYDTPMQEAYVDGYWSELVSFTRSLFNSAFKTNPYLERAIMTGITRVSKESIFSDLNNLVVVTTTSDMYETCFGFTEREVLAALTEYDLTDKFLKLKDWYDGFTFGSFKDIYNPWSIINFLKYKKFAAYWANTSSNSLVSKLIQESSRTIKQAFEVLMTGAALKTQIDEQIVYNQLNQDESAIWSLLLASGYLKVEKFETMESDYDGRQSYELVLTNREVTIMFRNMIHGWFQSSASDYNDFIKALLMDDVEAMNLYMNKVALKTFSYFDTGKQPSSQSEPERFYHGFVLGLMVALADRYYITSNQESGFGRYDIMLQPREDSLNAIIIEFKVCNRSSNISGGDFPNRKKEQTLEDTVQSALKQINEKKYAEVLETKGIPKKRIRCYGFAFEGKTVLIG